jgi:16S rRNA G966 N2-methylase RsmD
METLILNKEEISKKIKNIDLNTIDKEMNELIKIGKNAYNISSRSRTGNNIVDYFTFTQRLETKGKYNVNFYEFLSNIEEFKKKKFIQTMLEYYKNVKNKNNTKNEIIVYKEIYNICISAINIIRPLNYMEIYTKYNAINVLDFCAGWGGAAVAASALNLNSYIGIEINNNLKEPYNNLVSYLNKNSNTNIQMFFEDALNFDYSKMDYNVVFTSPPYYFIQKYENNTIYNSKKEMDELFYKPIFMKTYNGLQKNGHYIINVCKEVYNNVLKELFGEAHEIFTMKKSQRQNNYTEMIYVWKKI